MKQFILGISLIGCSFPLLSNQGLERPLLLNEVPSGQLFTEQQIHNQLSETSLVIAKNTKMTILQQEFDWYEKVRLLNIRNISKSDIEFLNKMTTYESQAFRVHQEGPLPLQIFDISSSAKHQLQQIHYLGNQKYLEQLKNQSLQSYYHAVIHEKNISTEAKIESLRNLSATEAKFLSLGLIDNNQIDSPILTKAVMLSKDKKLISMVLVRLDDHTAHKILINAKALFSNYELMGLYKHVIENNSYLASQAIFQYAELSESYHENSYLISLLSNKKLGSSAANAVSKKYGLLQEVATLIKHNNHDRIQVANALLSLKLSDSQLAKNLLVSLNKNNQIPFEDMSLEVAKWLD